MMGLSKKRFALLSSLIGIFITTISWHLSDTGLVSTDDFFSKLYITIGTWIVIQIAIYILLGRKED